MTDPTGPCFLSYKRERAVEAALLVNALKDHGIPVWQDVSDLPNAMTETALAEVLNDDATSAAVLLITPEVERSAVIRNVEVPAVFGREARMDGFYAMPVLAGGLGYADANRILGPGIGLADLSGFNMLLSRTDPIASDFARQVAQRALRMRLSACIRAAGPGAPLTLQVSTRPSLPKEPGFTLRADMGHRFQGRHAQTETWERDVLPAFQAIGDEIARAAAGRELHVAGYPSLPAAIALGAALPSLGPVRASWLQEQAKFGAAPERWSLDVAEVESGFRSQLRPLDPAGTDLALLVSVTNDVTHGFSLSREGLPLRGVIHVAPTGPRPDRIHLDAETARHVASQAMDAARGAMSNYRLLGSLHLFLAVPAGLAFMIGQQLNTFTDVLTYEYDPTGGGAPYKTAAHLRPSG